MDSPVFAKCTTSVYISTFEYADVEKHIQIKADNDGVAYALIIGNSRKWQQKQPFQLR